MNNDLMFSSKSVEWETPQWLFEELDKEFDFAFDVSANIKNAKCPLFYDEKQNGLIQPWVKTCWCNPPYGRKIGEWVKKAYIESELNKSTIVMLIPARTDTKYFHNFIWDNELNRPQKGVEVRFLKGRLKFGTAKNSAPFPSMVVIFKRGEQ